VRSRGDVAVIAATNRPDNIDPALLRPGIVHFVILFLSLALLHGHPNTLR
jgi:ATP-dependent 26S proteasome regulatory subunit